MKGGGADAPSVDPAEPRLAEQVALSEVDFVIEQFDQIAFLFDLLDDHIQTVPVELLLDVADRDVALYIGRRFQQEFRVDLDVAEAARRQAEKVEVEVGHLIEREAEAQFGQPRQIFDRFGRRIIEVGLADLEIDAGRQLRILVEQDTLLGSAGDNR